MKAFDDLLELIRQRQNEVNPDIVAELKKIGREVIETAAMNKAPGNILGHQIDAYGYGVFFNRKLVKGTQGYIDKKSIRVYEGAMKSRDGKVISPGNGPDRRRGKYGRVEALHAVQGYVPDSDGYVLFVTNAMYYSAVHEDPHKGQRHLPVLSQVLPLMIERANSDKVKIELVIFGW